MRRVLRIAVLAGGIVGALDVSAAFAAKVTAARLWDGSVVITDATPQCAASFGARATGSFRALYREHLKPTDPEAAVIFQADDLNHIVVIRATNNNKDIAGSNLPYCGIDFDPARGESTTWFGGKMSFKLRHFSTSPGKPAVEITGNVTKFGNIDGCNITLRGAFLRRP